MIRYRILVSSTVELLSCQEFRLLPARFLPHVGIAFADALTRLELCQRKGRSAFSSALKRHLPVESKSNNVDLESIYTYRTQVFEN